MTEYEQQLLQLLQKQAEQLTGLSLSHAQTTQELVKLSQQQNALAAQQAEICALLKTEQRLPQEVLKQTSEHLAAASGHLAALSTQQKQTSEHLSALSTHQKQTSEHLSALSTHQKQTSEHLSALSTHQQSSSTQLNQVLQALAKPHDKEALQQALSESLRPLRESLQTFAQLLLKIDDRL